VEHESLEGLFLRTTWFWIKWKIWEGQASYSNAKQAITKWWIFTWRKKRFRPIN